jgi:hypothetical protein
VSDAKGIHVIRPPDQRRTGSLKRISAVSGQRVSAGTNRFGQ